MMSIASKITKKIFFICFLLSSFSLSADLKKAKAFLKKGEYAKSAALFSKESDSSKGKSKKEILLANYGAAYSLRALDLNVGALDFFLKVIKEGPKDNSYFLKSLNSVHKIYEILDFPESYFSKALEKVKLNPKGLPEGVKGFFLYFKGKSLFEAGEYKKALKYFSSVSDLDTFYTKALFYRAVCENLLEKNKESVLHFEILLEELKGNSALENMLDQVILNLARIHYEEERFEKAVESYGLLSRNSPFWLDAIFEASWAFSLLKNPSNALGNIQTVLSPFYVKRFYPEAHILRTISLFQLCYYDEVKVLIEEFSSDFKPLQEELTKLIKALKRKTGSAFAYVRDGDLNSNSLTSFVFLKGRELSAYKKALLFLENLAVEQEELKTYFDSTVALNFLKKSEVIKKEILVFVDAKILKSVEGSLDHLESMFEQSILIEAEFLLKNIARIKKELNLVKTDGEEEFIGGMQKLVLGQALEYWPYDGEHWKDELGGYVYNIPNLCRK